MTLDETAKRLGIEPCDPKASGRAQDEWLDHVLAAEAYDDEIKSAIARQMPSMAEHYAKIRDRCVAAANGKARS